MFHVEQSVKMLVQWIDTGFIPSFLRIATHDTSHRWILAA